MKPYYDDGRGIVIYHGDCLDFIDKIDADALITDPPYGLNLGNHQRSQDRFDGGLTKGKYESYDDTPENFSTIVVPAIVRSLARVARGAVWAAGSKMWELPPADVVGGVYLPAACGRTKWGFNSLAHVLLYGVRPRGGMGNFPTAIKGTARAERNGHPCPKPYPWMHWLVGFASEEDDTVFDPFMGSGTTLVAAKQLNRKCIGIEIEERYCEIAARRLAQEVFDFGAAS